LGRENQRLFGETDSPFWSKHRRPKQPVGPESFPVDGIPHTVTREATPWVGFERRCSPRTVRDSIWEELTCWIRRASYREGRLGHSRCLAKLRVLMQAKASGDDCPQRAELSERGSAAIAAGPRIATVHVAKTFLNNAVTTPC
jgi:hypothetical protein